MVNFRLELELSIVFIVEARVGSVQIAVLHSLQNFSDGAGHFNTIVVGVTVGTVFEYITIATVSRIDQRVITRRTSSPRGATLGGSDRLKRGGGMGTWRLSIQVCLGTCRFHLTRWHHFLLTRKGCQRSSCDCLQISIHSAGACCIESLRAASAGAN